MPRARAREHVVDPKGLLEKLVSYLNPEGKLFLTVVDPDPYHPMHFRVKADFWDYVKKLKQENKIGHLWFWKKTKNDWTLELF